MKVSDNITVDFRHNMEEKITTCVLTAYGEESKAEAKCSPEDPYNRKIGRKLSLQRVLKESDLTRDGRTKVWQVLRDRKVKLAF